MPAMSVRRCDCVAAILGGKIYVCGGWNLKNQERQDLRSAERFDPVACTWEHLPDMCVARWGFAVGVVMGKLYVCGGANKKNSTLHNAERFDPYHNRWELLPMMLEGRGGCVGSALQGKLYVCGGVAAKWDDGLSCAECFDPHYGVWELLPNMSGVKWTAAAAAMKGELYICGGFTEDMGEDNGCPPLRLCECFDPVHKAWKMMPEMLLARGRCASAVLTGKLYVCGGTGPNGKALRSAECFDPQQNGWDSLPAMPVGRQGAAMVSLGRP